MVGEATLALGFSYLGRAEKTVNDKATRRTIITRRSTMFQTALDDGKVTLSAKQRAMLAMAQAYFDLKQYSDAEAICSKALETVNPDDPLAYRLELWRGHALYNNKHYHDAITAYTQVTNSHNTDMVTEALYWLGSSWYHVAENM